MELLVLFLGLVSIGYFIFFLVLPFIIKGGLRRLDALEKELAKLDDSLREQSRFLSRLKAQETEPVEFEAAAAEEEAAAVVEEDLKALQPVPPPDEAVEETPWTEAEVMDYLQEQKVISTEAPTSTTGALGEPVKAKESVDWQPLVSPDKAWLLGGNTVARVGIFILFLGVAFFLKYAVDSGWLPIELRLIGAAVGGLVLIAIGWRLRARRLNYALILQGGGMGIVYLTVFTAIKLYDLIATTPGLLLMIALVILSSALAVLQNARSLAVLAMVGGFLAPILISHEGNHVFLFSYYAVLNTGILGMAWFKAWRELNLVGFVFTFVIGGIWGYRYYQPEYFATTEPFLVLFFLFYLAVPVLFAQRQTPNLKGYIDGSLVFGVPLVAFGLQSALVHDIEYGLALSAIGAGLIYVILATILWRERRESVRMLTEAFLALAVAFGTLAIPLAVDGRWTGAAWALEGAALVWIGIRQDRPIARLFGLFVQAGAGIAFLTEFGAPTADVPMLNSIYLSALMVSFSGLFTGSYLSRHRQALRKDEVSAPELALLWGLAWWFGAGIYEILKHAAHVYHESAILSFIAVSVAVITALRRRLDWQQLSWPPVFLLPVMVLVAVDPGVAHPVAHWGWCAWTIAFLVQYWLLKRLGPEWPMELASFWHSATLWLAVFLVTWEAAWSVEQVTSGPTWRYITWALVPAAVVMGLPRLESKLQWPIQQFKTAYLGLGLLPLVLVLGVWVLHASVQPGDPWPLPYLPVLNPLELSQCLVLSVILWWSWGGWVKISNESRWYAWSVVAFVTLNGMIARATHHLGNIEFDAWTLLSSPIYQSVLSICWTLAALSIMVTATQLKQRAAWVVGAVLLGAVVAKLFLVDLEDTGTVARIVSFIVVGLLILLIGYISPLPPRTKERTES